MSEPIITSSGAYYQITLEEKEINLIIECLKKEALSYSYACPINIPRINNTIRELEVVLGVDRLQSVTPIGDRTP